MFKAGVQMKKFRWIHLSDIHFQTKNVSFNTQKLREKLPEFLAGLDGNFDAMITVSYTHLTLPTNREV